MSLIGASIVTETGVAGIEKGTSASPTVAGASTTSFAGLAVAVRPIGRLHAEA